MILYHGSNIKFDVILLSASKNRRDFGLGFYTTTLFEQARNWAEILNFRYKQDGIWTYEFDFTEDSVIKTKVFNGLSIEWLEFVKENRIKGGIQHDYDIVCGPVANDKTMETVGLYIDGIYTGEEALNRLKYMKPNNQISFHTDKSLAYLKLLKRTKWN
ncbi:MAG: DUF3990 domain-containing protein [Planctomycetaceae bacterium]|jgi:hypothetical protein|nr:DUF3990 domain-containing protein [Planctomycetaceae bacterium]